MAIGTAAAIVGSAALSAGASIIGGKKNSSAINRATDAQTEGNAASLAEQRRQFDISSGNLNPFIQRGNAAGGALNALLGLGGAGAAANPSTAAAPNASSQFQGYPGGAGIPYGIGDGFIGGGSFLEPGYQDASGFIGDFSRFVPNALAQFQQKPQIPAQTGIQPSVTTGAPQTAQDAQNAAFENFRNSTGYQFRVSEALDAANSGWAGAGLLQSGAAMQDIATRIGNEADNTFMNYAGLLSGQQGAGLQAAGAQAGVGVNYANAASNINAANANALSNAAIAQANNTNSLIGGLAGAGSQALGALAYRPPSSGGGGGWF